MSLKRFLPTLFVAALLSVPLFAQDSLQPQGRILSAPIGQKVYVNIDSGTCANGVNTTRLVFADTVSFPEAKSLRLYFCEVRLGEGSFLRISSLADSATVDMDAAMLRMWGYTTPYFNGSEVLIELYGGPNTLDNEYIIDQVWFDVGGCYRPLDYCGICGPDDRTPSGEEWSGRIMPVGCSGSVWNTESCVVSAGHCVGSDNVIQFRVPASNPDCSVVNPGPEDQFPITGRQYLNSGVGADWAVMTTGTNNLGQKAYERYGVYRAISSSTPGSGAAVNVWGYGIDTQCTRSQVQQDSGGGTIRARYSTYYTFDVDITFGNSGSGLIYNDEIIGIVTHCSDGCPNYATRVDRSDFAAARESLCPGPPECPPGCDFPNTYGGGTAGSGGFVPRISWDDTTGCASIGNPFFTIGADRCLGGASGLLTMGFSSTDNSSGAYRRLVNPVIWLPVVYSGAGAGNGSVAYTIPIPNNPLYVGLDIYAQFIVYDAGAARGIAATDGLHFEICQ
ncbi:MAG: trypsin-like serine protease [Planctomycetota bacterium]